MVPNRRRTKEGAKGRWDALVNAVRRDEERLILRLQRNVRDSPEEGPMVDRCILWTGPRRRGNGYGVFNLRFRGKHVQMSAHELFAMLLLKRPVRAGKDVEHVCENRLCVRHLREVTHRENCLRRDGKK